MPSLSPLIYLGRLDAYCVPAVTPATSLSQLLKSSGCEMPSPEVLQQCAPVPSAGTAAGELTLLELSISDAVGLNEVLNALQSLDLRPSTLASQLALLTDCPGLIEGWLPLLILPPLSGGLEANRAMYLLHDGIRLSLSVLELEDGLWGRFLMFAASL